MPVIITNWSMSCAVGEVVTVDVTLKALERIRNTYGIW